MDFFYIYNMEKQIVENKNKPYVCISDFTLVFVEKKWMARIKHKNPKVARESREKYVKEKKFFNYPITLDDSNKFPTKKTEKRVLLSAWQSFNKKNNFENFVMYIKNINTKHKSKVSYDFDYQKD